MKKLMLTALVASVFSFGVTVANPPASVTKTAPAAKVAAPKNEKLVSIDSISLFQQSKEGQEFAEEMRKKVEKFQAFVQESQTELVKMQQELQTKAAVLDAKVIQEKNQEIALKKKRAERDLADKEENLRVEIQNKQMEIREHQLSAANEVFKKEKWDMMVDKQTPGLLFVNSAIDKTDQVLKAVDAKYLASLTTKKTVEQKTIKA